LPLLSARLSNVKCKTTYIEVFFTWLFGSLFSYHNASLEPEFKAYDPHVGQTTGQADTAYFDGEEPVMGQME
jgi:hypothetical protein